MSKIKNFVIKIFNLDNKKYPYSKTQIAGIFGIILFIFPVIFNIFGFLSIPIAYMIEFIFTPRDPKALFIAKLAIAFLRIIFGLVSGIWISKLIWPKRIFRPFENKVENENIVLDTNIDKSEIQISNDSLNKRGNIISDSEDAKVLLERTNKLARKLSKKM